MRFSPKLYLYVLTTILIATSSSISGTSVTGIVHEAWLGTSLQDRSHEHEEPIILDMQYQLFTGVGIKSRFPVRTYGAVATRYDWDFDGDGWIDQTLLWGEDGEFVYDHPGTYLARMYALRSNGDYSLATVRVEVGTDVTRSRVQEMDFELSYWGMQQRAANSLKSPQSGSNLYFLLVADESESRFWGPVHNAYKGLVDSFGYADERIIVVAGCEGDLSQCGTVPSSDTSIIDYRFTIEGLDSAYNYLLSAMTSQDTLHVLNSGHGSGMLDSTCLIYNDFDCAPFETRGGRIFSGESDPDIEMLESEFHLLAHRNYGQSIKSKGLYEWYGFWKSEKYVRTKAVATFSGESFANSTKVSDTDIYIEYIGQYLKGDTNRNYKIDEGEVFDWNNNGVPPIALQNGDYVYDEGDWSENYLGVDPEHGDTVQEILNILFDAGFDSTLDFCHKCESSLFENPPVRGTDFDNDGIYDRLDANGDGDYTDSIGFHEKSFLGLDNVIAEFLDSLSYAHVSFSLTNCFGGGFIDDLSRPAVVVATATTSGTLAYANGFASHMAMTMTGIRSDSDRVITIAQAFNEYADDRARLDDNGDRMGHPGSLPSGGDGYLADSISWGVLPPTPPIPEMIWPGDGDTVYTPYPTFVWNDSASLDSVEIWWSKNSNGTGGQIVSTADSTCSMTALNHLPFVPWDAYYWKIRAYKGLSMSRWSTDSLFFSALADYSCCEGMRGNVNQDTLGLVNLTDLTMLVNALYNYTAILPCITEANVDGMFSDMEIPYMTDVTYLTQYLFNSGPPPVSCDSLVGK
jgi:hypothetical protein